MVPHPLPLCFVQATLADLPFVERLRRRDSAALGFLSRRALEQKIRAGHVRLAVLKDHSGSLGKMSTSDSSGSFGMDDQRPPSAVTAGSSLPLRAGMHGVSGSFGAKGKRPPVAPRRPVGFILHGSLRMPEVRIFQLAVDPDYRNRGIARRLLADLLRHCRRGGRLGLSLRCRETLPANRFWFSAGFVLHDLEAARRGALYVWVRPIARLPTQNEATETPSATAPRHRCLTRAKDRQPSRRRAVATPGVQNEATAIRPFRFHSRWHACPGCGEMTCGSWSAGGVRRGTCGECSTESGRKAPPHAEAMAANSRG